MSYIKKAIKRIIVPKGLQYIDISVSDEIIRVHADKKYCYCGEEIDYTNPDCVNFNLCKGHAIDC